MAAITKETTLRVVSCLNQAQRLAPHQDTIPDPVKSSQVYFREKRGTRICQDKSLNSPLTVADEHGKDLFGNGKDRSPAL
jgi:hypothetical protein